MKYALYTETATVSPALTEAGLLTGDEEDVVIFEAEGPGEAIRKLRSSAPDYERIMCVLVRPMRSPGITFIESGLRSLQSAVDGNIEFTPCPGLTGVDIICNEEAKLIRLPPNRALRSEGQIYDVICGNMIVAGSDEDGYIKSLEDDLAVLVFEMFRYPEIFIFGEGSDRIRSVSCPPEIARFMRENGVSIIR